MGSQTQILTQSKFSKHVYRDGPVGNDLAVLASEFEFDPPHTHRKLGMEALV